MQKKGRAEVSFSGRLAAGYGLEIGVYACLGYHGAKLNVYNVLLRIRSSK